MVWLMWSHTGNAGLRGSLGSSGGRGQASMLEGEEGSQPGELSPGSNEPEEIVVYPIPQQCQEMKGLVSPSTLSGTKRQIYTIVQEVLTFNYPATLCIVHRSRAYYDCVWKSHV